MQAIIDNELHIVIQSYKLPKKFHEKYEIFWAILSSASTRYLCAPAENIA
jgi:hypothetical protein